MAKSPSRKYFNLAPPNSKKYYSCKIISNLWIKQKICNNNIWLKKESNQEKNWISRRGTYRVHKNVLAINCKNYSFFLNDLLLKGRQFEASYTFLCGHPKSTIYRILLSFKPFKYDNWDVLFLTTRHHDATCTPLGTR